MSSSSEESESSCDSSEQDTDKNKNDDENKENINSEAQTSDENKQKSVKKDEEKITQISPSTRPSNKNSITNTNKNTTKTTARSTSPSPIRKNLRKRKSEEAIPAWAHLGSHLIGEGHEGKYFSNNNEILQKLDADKVLTRNRFASKEPTLAVKKRRKSTISGKNRDQNLKPNVPKSDVDNDGDPPNNSIYSDFKSMNLNLKPKENRKDEGQIGNNNFKTSPKKMLDSFQKEYENVYSRNNRSEIDKRKCRIKSASNIGEVDSSHPSYLADFFKFLNSTSENPPKESSNIKKEADERDIDQNFNEMADLIPVECATTIKQETPDYIHHVVNSDKKLDDFKLNDQHDDDQTIENKIRDLMETEAQGLFPVEMSDRQSSSHFEVSSSNSNLIDNEPSDSHIFSFQNSENNSLSSHHQFSISGSHQSEMTELSCSGSENMPKLVRKSVVKTKKESANRLVPKTKDQLKIKKRNEAPDLTRFNSITSGSSSRDIPLIAEINTPITSSSSSHKTSLLPQTIIPPYFSTPQSSLSKTQFENYLNFLQMQQYNNPALYLLNGACSDQHANSLSKKSSGKKSANAIAAQQAKILAARQQTVEKEKKKAERRARKEQELIEKEKRRAERKARKEAEEKIKMENRQKNLKLREEKKKLKELEDKQRIEEKKQKAKEREKRKHEEWQKKVEKRRKSEEFKKQKKLEQELHFREGIFKSADSDEEIIYVSSGKNSSNKIRQTSHHRNSNGTRLKNTSTNLSIGEILPENSNSRKKEMSPEARLMMEAHKSINYQASQNISSIKSQPTPRILTNSQSRPTESQIKFLQAHGATGRTLVQTRTTRLNKLQPIGSAVKFQNSERSEIKLRKVSGKKSL